MSSWFNAQMGKSFGGFLLAMGLGAMAERFLSPVVWLTGLWITVIVGLVFFSVLFAHYERLEKRGYYSRRLEVLFVWTIFETQAFFLALLFLAHLAAWFFGQTAPFSFWIIWWFTTGVSLIPIFQNN